MNDYLGTLCKNLGIKLVYMTNKVTLLSCGVRNNIPIIRAHNIFKNCPENIAISVIRYYTESQNANENLKIIQKYIKESFSSNQFKIQSASDDFKQIVIKGMPAEATKEDNSVETREYKISSIVQTDFYGNETIIEPSGTIRPTNDDFLELDITVLPPVT